MNTSRTPVTRSIMIAVGMAAASMAAADMASTSAFAGVLPVIQCR